MTQSSRAKREGISWWRKLLAGQVSRVFAWAMGMQIAVWAFLDGFYPSLKVLREKPGWAQYPEAFVQVGGVRAWAGELLVALLLSLLASWFVSRVLEVALSWYSPKGNVRLEDDSVVVSYALALRGERSIPVACIASAIADGTVLTLRLVSGAEVVVRTPDAVALAEEVRQQRTAATTLPTGIGWDAVFGRWLARIPFAFCGLVALGFLGHWAGERAVFGQWGPSIVWGLCAALWLCLGWAGKMKQHVTVGNDGIRIDGFLRSRFIPFSELRSTKLRAQHAYQGVLLTLETGQEVKLGVDNTPELQRLIKQGLADYRAREAATLSDVHAHALERGDKSAAEWRESVKGRLADAGYRAEKLRVEDLAEVVDDATASRTQRVGAALAIAGESQYKDRVRIAADLAADRELQAALDAAAEELSGRPLERRLRLSADES